MPAQAILNDPLLASLFHFCTLRALPATFLLTPGSKATTRAKSDGTATEAEALGAALHAFGLAYSAAEFQVRSFIHLFALSLGTTWHQVSYTSTEAGTPISERRVGYSLAVPHVQLITAFPSKYTSSFCTFPPHIGASGSFPPFGLHEFAPSVRSATARRATWEGSLEGRHVKRV